MCSDVQAFEQYCRDQACEFQALSAPGGGRIEIRFTGRFRGQPVLWHAVIMTLEYYRHQQPTRADAPGGDRQFIYVGEQGKRGRYLEIGLDTLQIDEPTIRKTMIMIRQWRNLDFGLHEFGSG